MTKCFAPVLLVLLLVLLSGCGGGGGSTPVLIAGNYFPLVVGTEWVYDTILEAATPSDVFSTTGTLTRRVNALIPITVRGENVLAYEVQHTYTTNAIPNLNGPASLAVNKALRYLFSKKGGLQPVKAYYVLRPATATRTARIELVALAENGGPRRAIDPPSSFLINPPYQGTAQYMGMWFVPMPLCPPTADMTEFRLHDKVLDYDDLIGMNGTTHAIVSIYYHACRVNLDGETGELSGRGRSYLLNGLGLASGAAEFPDWEATLQVNGSWVRVLSQVTLRSMTTPAPE